jgi:hypothetical protein
MSHEFLDRSAGRVKPPQVAACGGGGAMRAVRLARRQRDFARRGTRHRFHGATLKRILPQRDEEGVCAGFEELEEVVSGREYPW